MFRSIPWIVLLVASLLLLVQAQQCYYPDGTESEDVPCNATATASACCSKTGYCLANGLCLEDGVLNRESCTDKTWKSASCPQECTTDPDFLNMNNALMACSNTTFTCGFYPDNCTVTANTFKLTKADSLVLTASQLTSAMEDAGIATNTTDPTETPSGTVGVVTVTATGLVKPADPSLLFTTGQMVGIGAGIGVPMLLAIGVLSFLLMQEKKKHKVTEITEGGFRPPPTMETNSWSAWTESTKAARSPTSVSGVGMSNMHPGVVADRWI